MSSASRKQPPVHADAGILFPPAPSGPLCYRYEKGLLGPEGARRAALTRNPNAVTCKACKGLLRERGQLYAIMLCAWRAECEGKDEKEALAR